MNLTVVIPCYNEDPANLLQAVGSIPKDLDTEVIVVNDGSTREETLAVLDSLDAVVIHQRNAGVAAARNVGIAAGTGHYILPLDSDDYLLPGFIECLVQHMDTHDTTSAATEWQSFGHTTDRHLPPEVVTAPEMVRSCPINNSCLFRRHDWEKLGGYDETLRIGFEDWEWWTRLLLQTAGVARRAEGPGYMYRVSRRGRNLNNYNGIDALTATRSAMVKNNPGLEKEIIPGLLQDLELSFFLGQNQSPLAAEATRQAQYWARRYGKLEGLRTRLERSLGLGR